MSFREAEPLEWEIGPARIRAQAVNHRGPTLGYRIEDGDTSLCYIPDHEPGLGAPLAELEDDWISGFELARGASMLIHDCQYTDEEYPNHSAGAIAPVSDALGFGRRVEAERLLLFHHDPLHTDDFLDHMGAEIDAPLAGARRRSRAGRARGRAARADRDGRRPRGHADRLRGMR